MIIENLQDLRERIVKVCGRFKRNPEEIGLVAVAKSATVEMIKSVLAVGISDIGENRLQDALSKFNALRNTHCAIRPRWHMVGHLQTNKVKDAIEIFDLIQSVDSLKVAQEIQKCAAKINKVQDILVQVNTSQEATKFGLRPEETLEVIRPIAQLKNIRIQGLMTIAPLVDNPEKARPYFRRLRELRDEINQLQTTNYKLHILSMGMTDDFEVAIEEGSSMLRIGRGIFGTRMNTDLSNADKHR